MATESTPQITTASVDRLGISVATSSRNVRSARAGTAYDDVALAAAQPVWFHPLPDGRYLALFSRRLTSATAGGTGEAGTILCASATTDTEPCWSRLDPHTGQRGAVEAIPSRQPGTRTLTAAATQGSLLFTLNLHRRTGSATTNALLQHFRVTSRDNLVLEAEEFIPGNLGLGLYVDRTHVWVFGNDGKGELALARKNWGRIGTNADPNAARNWQYRGLGGWFSDPKKMTPLPGPGNKGLPAAGPCSVGLLRDRFYLAATAEVPGLPAADGGLSISTDSGRTFTNRTTTDGLGSLAVNAVRATDDGVTVYAATRGGLSISTDRGATFTNRTTANGLGSDNVYGVFVDGQRVYAATAGGLGVSTDGGTTFTNRTTQNTDDGLGSDTVYGVHAVRDGPNNYVVYAATASGLSVSTDGGATFTRRTTANGLGSNTVLGVHAVGNAILAATTAGLSICTGVSAADLTTAARSVFTNRTTTNGLGSDKVLGVHVRDGVIHAATTAGLSRSTDGGVTFTNRTTTNSALADDDVRAVYVGPTGTVYACTPSGLSVAPRGGTFTTRTTEQGLGNDLVAGVYARDNLVYVATGGGYTVGARANPLAGLIDRLTGVVNGVVNGFIGIGTGVVAVITDLLSQAVGVVTGVPGAKDGAVAELVEGFLRSLTGLPDQVTGLVEDPASILGDAMGAITGLPVVGGVVASARDFLDDVVTTALGLASAVVGPGPVALLTGIIKTLTGVDLTDTATTDTELSDIAGRPATPSTWNASVYTTRKVDEAWSRTRSGVVELGDESTYLGGGLYLQPQLGLSRGFSRTVTTDGVTVLDPTSHHVQVFTGSASQTVVLPATARVSGTVVETDGSVTVPESELPRLSISDASFIEGNAGTSVIRFTVTSTMSCDTPVTVDYETVAGTASPGSDYTAASGTLTIDGGTTSQQVAITINGDAEVEPDETFTVVLSNPTGATITTATATGTVVNDEAATALEPLLEDLRNIVSGITSGAIQTGAAISLAVATILEQSARTITGVVGDVGEAVLGLVDDFLAFVSAGAVDLPGEYGTPGEMLADIVNQVSGGSAVVDQTLTDLGDTLFSAITGAATPLVTSAVDAFHQIVNAITGVFSFRTAAAAAQASPGGTTAPVTNRVSYMSYTIHNQSTADLRVTASGRDRTVTVPHGVGMVFTPYTAEPTTLPNWSWTLAGTRAPKARTGFAHVHTVGLGTAGSATPEGDFTLRTRWSVFDPTEVPAPVVEATTPTAPGTTASDPDALARLMRQFTIVTNQINTGVLSISTGSVDTVTALLLDAVSAMTGDAATDYDGTIRALTTGFLQDLARTGSSESTATALENLIRQITGGTGLTGGVVQGTTVATPLDFIQQVSDAVGDLAEEVVAGLSNVFAQLVSAITGK